MAILTIEEHPHGKRLWLFDTWRIHGFLCGLLLCAAAFGAGVALLIHDWHDRARAMGLR